MRSKALRRVAAARDYAAAPAASVQFQHGSPKLERLRRVRQAPTVSSAASPDGKFATRRDLKKLHSNLIARARREVRVRQHGAVRSEPGRRRSEYVRARATRRAAGSANTGDRRSVIRQLEYARWMRVHGKAPAPPLNPYELMWLKRLYSMIRVENCGPEAQLQAQLKTLVKLMSTVGIFFTRDEMAVKFGVDLKRNKPIAFENFCCCVYDLSTEYQKQFQRTIDEQRSKMPPNVRMSMPLSLLMPACLRRERVDTYIQRGSLMFADGPKKMSKADEFFASSNAARTDASESRSDVRMWRKWRELSMKVPPNSRFFRSPTAQDEEETRGSVQLPSLATPNNHRGGVREYQPTTPASEDELSDEAASMRAGEAGRTMYRNGLSLKPRQRTPRRRGAARASAALAKALAPGGSTNAGESAGQGHDPSVDYSSPVKMQIGYDEKLRKDIFKRVQRALGIGRSRVIRYIIKMVMLARRAKKRVAERRRLAKQREWRESVRLAAERSAIVDLRGERMEPQIGVGGTFHHSGNLTTQWRRVLKRVKKRVRRESEAGAGMIAAS